MAGHETRVIPRRNGDVYCLECGKRQGSFACVEIQTRRGDTIYVCHACMKKRMKYKGE